MLAPQWTAAMKALGKPEFSVNQIVAFNIIGLVYGILVVWLYAMIRPRYGAGPKTAACAGLVAWAIGALLPNASLMSVAGLFPSNLTVMTTAAAIVESVVAALAGAALYKEGTGSAQSKAAGT
jgi:xanthosine utilization system XapX-like protein